MIPIEPGEDAEQIARLCIQSGKAEVVGALRRRIEPAELAPYVPGIARSPDVLWICALQQEREN